MAGGRRKLSFDTHFCLLHKFFFLNKSDQSSSNSELQMLFLVSFLGPATVGKLFNLSCKTMIIIVHTSKGCCEGLIRNRNTFKIPSDSGHHWVTVQDMATCQNLMLDLEGVLHFVFFPDQEVKFREMKRVKMDWLVFWET